MQGWISLHRRVTESWIYKKPNYFHWFIHLLFKVNFKDNDKVLFNGEFVTVKRGQTITSIGKLAKELPECTEQKIRTFLKLLEKSNTIELKSTHSATWISILNYDSYQTEQHGEQQTNNKPATNQQQTNNNNRIKKNKDNKENKDIKKTLLSDLKESDFDNPEYFNITISFYELFIKNLEEKSVSTAKIKRSRGVWIDYIRLLVEKDKYTLEDCRKVFKFLQVDEFWKTNILSTQKLREKFEKLLMNANKNETNRRNSKGATPEELAAVIYKHTKDM